MPPVADDMGDFNPGFIIFVVGFFGFVGLMGYVFFGRRRGAPPPMMPPPPPGPPQAPQFSTSPHVGTWSGSGGTVSSGGSGPSYTPAREAHSVPPPPVDFDGALAWLAQGDAGTQELRVLEPLLRAGVRDGGRPAVERLLTLLATGDTALMAVIADVLAEQPAESRELLTTGLGGAPSEIRPYYAHLLGLQRDRAAAPALIEATGDPDEMVAYWAGWALDQMPDEE